MIYKWNKCSNFKNKDYWTVLKSQSASYLQETYLNCNDTNDLKKKDRKEILTKEAGVALLIFDKVNCKTIYIKYK